MHYFSNLFDKILYANRISMPNTYRVYTVLRYSWCVACDGYWELEYFRA